MSLLQPARNMLGELEEDKKQIETKIPANWRGFLLYTVDVYIAVGDGVDGQGGDALESELIHDVLAVGNDRRQADI